MVSYKKTYALFVYCFYGDELLKVFDQKDMAEEEMLRLQQETESSYYILEVDFVRGF